MLKRVIESIKHKIIPSKTVQLFMGTIIKWQQDDCLEKGAALSYYAIFSLFPILLVILSIFSLILGSRTNIYEQLLAVTQRVLPPESYPIVVVTLLDLTKSSISAGIIGFGILFITASRIFAALDQTVSKIWKHPDQKPLNLSWKAMILKYIRDKILAFFLVLSTAFLILLSLLSNIAIKVILEIIKNVESKLTWIQVDEALLWNSLQVSLTFILLYLVVMVLFKILPSTSVKWSDIWLGAILTVTLYSLLQKLVSSGVIRIGEQFRAYGVIGGFMMLLLWIFLTCQIFFLGCEFTYVYTHLFGSRRNQSNQRHPEVNSQGNI
ncbi:ribonuclease BN [Rippkaea orientalis PCC 8801]|uniref:Ribonuclease BN n=1 Tax=Rippkaea orientalis (strain PCC 8801 / RF-1) TaxID=41431 RepID=B7K5G4_RIPO1|nr:YihY/virulence factor BrkB family protein [Rippkaea orientalis]ACK66697.1 ribonuclease BN [Rippkaea orientalis PCC 8801]